MTMKAREDRKTSDKTGSGGRLAATQGSGALLPPQWARRLPVSAISMRLWRLVLSACAGGKGGRSAPDPWERGPLRQSGARSAGLRCMRVTGALLLVRLVFCTSALPAQEPAVKETPSANTPVPAATVSVPVQMGGLSARADGVSPTNVDDVKAVIEDQLGLAGDTAMSDPLADDLAFFLRQRFLDLGHPEATVAWTVEGGTAVLKVVEGPQYAVGSIAFEGNTSQKEEDLRAYLLRPTHEKLGRSDANPPLVEADIQKGAEMVQRYYQSQGYLNATVQEPVITMHHETKTQDILVKITEGARYDIGQVSVTGDWEPRRKEVMEAIEGMTGQPFSEVKIEDVRKQLVGIFQRRGYFDAAVTSSADPATMRGGPVPVVYHVVPGNLFRIAGISVAPGFSKGAERVVRASFKRSVNKVYSPADLDVMHRQALKSDVFSRLDVTPKKMTDDTITLQLTGEEGPPRTRAPRRGHLRVLRMQGHLQAGVRRLRHLGALGQVHRRRWHDPCPARRPRVRPGPRRHRLAEHPGRSNRFRARDRDVPGLDHARVRPDPHGHGRGRAAYSARRKVWRAAVAGTRYRPRDPTARCERLRARGAS